MLNEWHHRMSHFGEHRMKNWLWLIAVTALTACSSLGLGGSNTQPQTAPAAANKSAEMYQASCSGFLSWTDCNLKANQMCANGFTIAARDENIITQNRVMTFKCK